MNIGCVVYIKDSKTGKMSAKWQYAQKDRVIFGTGKAIGKAGSEYEGIYSITYIDDDGTVTEPINLMIERNDKSYLLKWSRSGKITGEGHGIEHDGCLIASYKDI